MTTKHVTQSVCYHKGGNDISFQFQRYRSAVASFVLIKTIKNTFLVIVTSSGTQQKRKEMTK